MKKINFSIIILLTIIASNSVSYAEVKKEAISQSDKTGYELYKKRVSDICDNYLYKNKDKTQWKIKQLIKIDENYPKIVSKEEIKELIWPLKVDLEEAEQWYNVELDSESFIQWGGNEWSNAYKNWESWKYDSNLTSEQNSTNHTNFLNKTETPEEKKMREKWNLIRKLEKEIQEKTAWLTDNYSLPNFKYIHKTNMNNIYKCAILEVQQKSLLLIKKDLINKNPSASKKIGLFVDINLNRIDISMNSLKCINTNDKSSIQKLNVLAQTTYQTCKYVSYLEYLKDYNSNLTDILPDNSSKISIAEITEIKKEKNDEINAEIKHTYKVFPLVFHAYTEYENNITIHFLLELVKEDYEILRAGLHKALNPINQVVYKISNIMKK